jgi:hypothetical protein
LTKTHIVLHSKNPKLHQLFKIFISNFLNYLSEIAVDVFTTPRPDLAFSDHPATEEKDSTTPLPFQASSDMNTTERVTAEEVTDNKPSKPTSDQNSVAVDDIRNMLKQGNKIYFVC